MISTLKWRVWVTATAFVLATAIGALVGYLVALSSIRQITENQLTRDATRIEGMVDSLLDESHALLAAQNASHYPFCSDAEINYFRSLIYHARNLRDAGRMRDGKMECSALFGRADLSHTEFKPNVTRQDGTKFYRDLPPYVSPTLSIFIMQQGDSYVVEDPSFQERLARINWNSETTMIDTASQKRGRASGLPLSIPDAIIDRDAHERVGDVLYVTHCSLHTAVCTTVYASYSAALRADRSRSMRDAAEGALCGALLVLAFALLRQRSRSMAQQLRRAIRQDKLQLVYQAIVEPGTGKYVGAETLARWTDEEGFAIGPEVFVQMAEERGFVHELTALVARRALREFAATLRSRPDFQLSVNVTAADLGDPGFLPMLEHALNDARVATHSLTIEVTESSTARKQLAKETIRRLRLRGHCVQIDDFGTGYSSLSYLHDLSVDGIKIDKAFTQAIGTKAVIGEILPQILAMAETLDLMVTVEGIETKEQADYFAGLARPVLGQGWLFGHPVPAEVFHRNLAVSP
jgi:sensor c-di-GMP phosphodiesterase-like protein